MNIFKWTERVFEKEQTQLEGRSSMYCNKERFYLPQRYQTHNEVRTEVI